MQAPTTNQVPSAFDSQEAQQFIGKHLLVGITYKNLDGTDARLEQFHGIIVRANMQEGIVLKLIFNGEERRLPPDLSHLERATAGSYRLKSTGELVESPDLLASWSVYPAE